MRRNRYTLVELVTVTAILLVVLAVGTARLSVELLDGGPYQKAEQLRRIAALCRRQAAAGGAEPRGNRLKRRFALRAVEAFALSKPLC